MRLYLEAKFKLPIREDKVRNEPDSAVVSGKIGYYLPGYHELV
jgi:hypothetical protein